LLFCPYCNTKEKASDKKNAFDDVGGFFLTDGHNNKKMMLRTHSHGCGHVFIAVYDGVRAEYMACFKLPQEGWVKAIFYRPQI